MAAARYDTIEVLRDIEAQTGGLLAVGDFVPSPVAHPLCYQCCYLLQLEDGAWVPFTRFMRRDQLRALLAEELYILPGPRLEAVFQEVIDALWSGEFACPEADRVLTTLRP